MTTDYLDPFLAAHVRMLALALRGRPVADYVRACRRLRLLVLTQAAGLAAGGGAVEQEADQAQVVHGVPGG